MSCNPFIQLFKFNHQMIMPFRWINCFKILRSDLKVRQKLLLQLEILCFVFLILKLIHHFYKKGLLNKNNKHLHLTYKSNSCCFFSSSFSLSLYVFCKGKGHTYFETWSSVSLVDGTSNSDDSIMYLFVWLFRSFGWIGTCFLTSLWRLALLPPERSLSRTLTFKLLVFRLVTYPPYSL